jgi:hypothetical protein
MTGKQRFTKLLYILKVHGLVINITQNYNSLFPIFCEKKIKKHANIYIPSCPVSGARWIRRWGKMDTIINDTNKSVYKQTILSMLLQLFS